MHSSGPWKDHKYKERSGSPGNYTYKYGNSNGGGQNDKGNSYDGTKASVYADTKDWYKRNLNNGNIDQNEAREKIRNSYAYERTGYGSTRRFGSGGGQMDRSNRYAFGNGSNLASNWAKNKDELRDTGYRRDVLRDIYAYERTGAGTTKAVGGDSKRNEIKRKQAKEAQKRKDFEKMTLTSMRNALNQAKENKKRKSDADMRDTAVARGREQYMTNRAKKTVGAMTKAIEKKREEEKRKAYSHSRLNRIMGR